MARAAKSFFQLADRLARARAAVASMPRARARGGGLDWHVAKKHGNFRCFCLRRTFATGSATAPAVREWLPRAALGGVATRCA